MPLQLFAPTKGTSQRVSDSRSLPALSIMLDHCTLRYSTLLDCTLLRLLMDTTNQY